MQETKMFEKDLVLGIDTSNYTTSLGVTDRDGRIIVDSRKSLTVKQGEKGLRQSYALFQHIENLPEMILNLFQEVDKNRIAAIACSDKPRPVEGSYMPVFKAGVNYGTVLAAGLGVPFFAFSHQEGHLAAVKEGSILQDEETYLSYHLSGGTSELLHVKGEEIAIIGGSKDISFGQVVDRIGVAMGLAFPAGSEMDRLALAYKAEAPGQGKGKNLLKKIPVDGLFFNLSGIETQCSRALDKSPADGKALVYELFLRIAQCLCTVTERAMEVNCCNKVLLAGGVSASTFLRNYLVEYFKNREAEIAFGSPELSSDNAVGLSFLGGKRVWL